MQYLYSLIKINSLVSALLVVTIAPSMFTSGALEPGLASAQEVIQFSKLNIAIETETGSHQFTVEIAETERQLARGLMGRQSLAVDAGMLFIYSRPRRAAMWMKDTLLPLDMLFVGEDGTIINIIERTMPMSLATLRSINPVRAVLEVNAGTVARLGIKPGNRVVHNKLFSSYQ